MIINHRNLQVFAQRERRELRFRDNLKLVKISRNIKTLNQADRAKFAR